MEDNIDSIKDTPTNKEDPINKDSLGNNNQKIQSNIIKDTQTENNFDTNKNNQIQNEKIIEANKNPAKTNPKKEIPIEKKPFNEFVNDYLIPSLIHELKDRKLEVKEINLNKTCRPIAGDLCWVIYCEIKDTCNFWLSFEKEDISSLKSISLCKFSQKPSVIESFLIDEKRITLKLIISRILQRLNGQKLLGVN